MRSVTLPQPVASLVASRALNVARVDRLPPKEALGERVVVVAGSPCQYLARLYAEAGYDLPAPGKGQVPTYTTGRRQLDVPRGKWRIDGNNRRWIPNPQHGLTEQVHVFVLVGVPLVSAQLLGLVRVVPDRGGYRVASQVRAPGATGRLTVKGPVRAPCCLVFGRVSPLREDPGEMERIECFGRQSI